MPTKNREQFLKRLLFYYSSLNFKGYICIGDSSEGEQLALNKKHVEAFKKKINIIYKECPGLNPVQAFSVLVKCVPTKYSAAVMDDDFIVTSGLEKGVKFLEENGDYSCVNGVTVRIYVKDDMPHGQILRCRRRIQLEEKAENASERYLDFMSHYDDIGFSLHRTEAFMQMYENAHNPDVVFFGEILPAGLSVIKGKVMELDCLYLIRQIKEPKKSYRVKEQFDTYLWITNPRWNSYMIICHDTLVNELMKQDMITHESACEVFRRGFMTHLYKRLVNEKKRQKRLEGLDVKEVDCIKLCIFNALGKYMSRCKEMCRKLKTLVCPTSKNEVSTTLQSLLNPDSPYHKDFVPIYRAVTVTPKERA